MRKVVSQWARKLKKKSRPKKLLKSNTSISRKIFLPNSIFCNFKNGQKSIFELGKSLKLKICHFTKFFLTIFDFTSFFAWTFLNFLAFCAIATHYTGQLKTNYLFLEQLALECLNYR